MFQTTNQISWSKQKNGRNCWLTVHFFAKCAFFAHHRPRKHLLSSLVPVASVAAIAAGLAWRSPRLGAWDRGSWILNPGPCYRWIKEVELQWPTKQPINILNGPSSAKILTPRQIFRDIPQQIPPDLLCCSTCHWICLCLRSQRLGRKPLVGLYWLVEPRRKTHLWNVPTIVIHNRYGKPMVFLGYYGKLLEGCHYEVKTIR